MAQDPLGRWVVPNVEKRRSGCTQAWWHRVGNRRDVCCPRRSWRPCGHSKRSSGEPWTAVIQEQVAL